MSGKSEQAEVVARAEVRMVRPCFYLDGIGCADSDVRRSVWGGLAEIAWRGAGFDVLNVGKPGQDDCLVVPCLGLKGSPVLLRCDTLADAKSVFVQARHGPEQAEPETEA